MNSLTEDHDSIRAACLEAKEGRTEMNITR